jgi:hypothetical protein
LKRIIALSVAALLLCLPEARPGQPSTTPRVPTEGRGQGAEVKLGPQPPHREAQRLAWLIWGQRGLGRRVSALSLSWPPGRPWSGDALRPEQWGRIRLLAQGEPPLGQEPELLAAAREPFAGLADGALYPGEWHPDRSRFFETEAGPMLLTASWNEGLLRLAVALLAVPAAGPQLKADLFLAGQQAGGSAAMQALSLRWDARLHRSFCWAGRFAGGQWRWTKLAPGSQLQRSGFQAGLSAQGDGSWPFVVAEYVVPLGGLLPPASAELKACLFITGLPARAGCDDALYWPAGHGPGVSCDEVLLCEHPDGWGTVRPAADGLRKGELLLGRLVSTPRLDGRLEPSEWAGSGEAEMAFLGLGKAALHVGLAGERLLVGIWCRPPRRGLAAPRLEICLDPQGDGGLLPRPDDRLLVLQGQPPRATLRRWAMPPGKRNEGIVSQEGSWRDEEACHAEGVVRAEEGTIAAEIAVPLRDLGLEAVKLPARLGLLVRLVYHSELALK